MGALAGMWEAMLAWQRLCRAASLVTKSSFSSHSRVWPSWGQGMHCSLQSLTTRKLAHAYITSGMQTNGSGPAIQPRVTIMCMFV